MLVQAAIVIHEAWTPFGSELWQLHLTSVVSSRERGYFGDFCCLPTDAVLMQRVLFDVFVQVDEYTSLVADFKGKADFVAIYVEEAHPADGWNFKIGPQYVQSIMIL
jgi:Iodothyronine deiodinase